MTTKRALITGAGRRLGQAMAVALGERGYTVAIHYNSTRTGADETLDRVKSAGGAGAIFQANLLDQDAVAELIPSIQKSFGGPLDLLINNASAFEDDDLLTHSQENWDLHFGMHVRAPVQLAQAFAAALPADKKGLIINMIDQRVLKLNPKFFTYTLSKTALWTATRTMAQALAPNIRVNGIGPGPTLQNERQEADDFAQQVNSTLTQEGASPAEICKALYYLIDASAVTGQMLAVDGGQHLIWQTPDIDGVVE
jgi:NAD(P)-dependent dehydrogenase (short-subunit alcohol dehydrogenase family)